MTGNYALSIKQPWATLLVHGLKTIEVRKWPTARRGRILIHAGRIPDDRPQGWSQLPKEWADQAKLLGGFVGAAELDECRTYRSAGEFSQDAPCHLNDPAWWQGPKLYGFRFTQVRSAPFVPYSGWMRIFPVPESLETLGIPAAALAP